MTRKDLEIGLAKIGWRIEKSGNGLNDYIINHFEERTSFVVQQNTIEVRADLFGGDTTLARDSCHFEFDNITVNYDTENEKAEWMSLDFNKNVFIQFYNHEKR